MAALSRELFEAVLQEADHKLILLLIQNELMTTNRRWALRRIEARLRRIQHEEEQAQIADLIKWVLER